MEKTILTIEPMGFYKNENTNLPTVWYKGYGCGSYTLFDVANAVSSIKELHFVHGSVQDLICGKTCVVRDQFVFLQRTGETFDLFSESSHDDGLVEYESKGNDIWIEHPDNELWQRFWIGYGGKKPPFSSSKIKEGKLVVLGRTSKMNFKIKLFK